MALEHVNTNFDETISKSHAWIIKKNEFNNELNNELNDEILSKIDQNITFNNKIETSSNPFLSEVEDLQAEPKIIPQDLFLSVDMGNSNLELIHF